MSPEPGGARAAAARPAALAAAAGAFVSALACALVLAGVTHPDMVFPKYLAAAAASPAEQAERLLDYSPLYLGLVRALLPFGFAAILAFQAVLHAATAAAAALAVGLLAGRGWAWLAGLGVASYRPFLTYCGIHEPETAILFCLALAVLFGLLARARLARPAGDPPEASPAAAAAAPRDRLATAPEGHAAPRDSDAAAPDPLAARRDSPLTARGSLAARRASLATGLLVAFAFACLAAAALGRPQHLLLVPAWALWMASAAPPARRRAAHRLVWPAALLVSAAVVGPPVAARARAAGGPTIMNPGAVFYEGNGPGATGLTRFAPPAVIRLEHAHRESVDYGHVAYRRIASAAAGRTLPPAAANRYWTELAWEAMADRPAAAARRIGRKALLSLAPYEGHDLLLAERLDRRLRRWLPWGFAVPLLAVAWVPLARRRRLADLGGPLVLAALACAVQAAAYASARQRLPAALALWIVFPVLASDLAGRRLGAAVRPLLVLVLGIGVALALAAATARVAVLDQLGWDRLLGRRPGPPALGDALCAIQDGRALRPRLRRLAERFDAGAALSARRRPADSLRVLAPLLGGGIDLTSDDRQIGVPEYWAALDFLALGDRPRAAAMARAAWTARPDDARIAALALRLARPREAPPPPPPAVAGWRPPGCDPVSSRLVQAAAAAADGDRPAALAILRPLAADLPELVR